MTKTTLPPPGAFFLRHIEGVNGRTIAAMQAFVRGGSFWTHAGAILDDGWAIQAQPGGAVIFPAGQLLDGKPVLFSDRPVQDWLKRRNPPINIPNAMAVHERVIRARIVANARKLEHEGYSYLDYPVLGLAELAHAHRDDKVLGWVVDRLRHRVEQTGHLICSALVDDVYLLSGIHLYDDKRLPGDVTPQDLAEYATVVPGPIVPGPLP